MRVSSSTVSPTPANLFRTACFPGCYKTYMVTVSLQELQLDPDALLDRVEAGEHLVVVRDGRPVAELRPVPATQTGPRPFGLCAGAFTVPDDFDAPLPGGNPAGVRGAMRLLLDIRAEVGAGGSSTSYQIVV